MNVLVTGGAGYIGSHTTKKLIDAGFAVTIIDNLSTGFREAIDPAARFVQGDIRNAELLDKVFTDYKIEAVVHFAAKLVVPESVEKPLDYYDNNLGGATALLQCCKKFSVDKFVFSSTAAVYGDAAVQLTGGIATESSATGPLNPYGWSKLMAEQIIRDCETSHKLKSVCLRYFNVAGADESGILGQCTKNATHLIKVAAQTALGLRPHVQVFGTDYNTPDGTGVRDYIHVNDLADLHVLALRYLMKTDSTSQVLNCGYGQGYSVRQILDTMKKVSGTDFAAKEIARRPGDAAQLIADSTRIRALFSWQPKRNDIELICRSAYEWEKKITSNPAPTIV